VVTPGVGGSKDPVAMADPQVEAWSAAEAAQSPDAMIAFLLAYPDGDHADEARAWLMARAIMPPGPAVQQPGPSNGVVSPPPSDAEFGYAQARARGTVQALWDFVKAFPEGEFTQMAVADLIRLGADARYLLAPGGDAMPTPQPYAQTPVAPEPAPQAGK
jgi:hypothetical protein